MKKNMKKIIVGALLFPVFAFAADVSNITSLINSFGGIINQIVPLILAVTVVYFIWNVAHFVMSGNAGVEAKRTEAINNIIWSIIAMFIMISIWGLIGILKGSFQFGTTVGTTEVKPFPTKVAE